MKLKIKNTGLRPERGEIWTKDGSRKLYIYSNRDEFINLMTGVVFCGDRDEMLYVGEGLEID